MTSQSRSRKSVPGPDLFVDAGFGVAGDMWLAALTDLGVDVEAALRPLEAAFPAFRVHRTAVDRRSIRAVHIRVEPLEEDSKHRHLSDVLALCARIETTERARERIERTFRDLAAAEARVHGVDIERVHFHEVGAIDSIVDVAGTILAVEALDPGRITGAPIAIGTGTVDTAHGRFPVPAPATLELLRGIPTRPLPVGREVTTPTGAALCRTLVESFGPPPAGIVEATGYGAGTREGEPDAPPNVLRLWTTSPARATSGREWVVEFETLVDHLSGEDLGHLIPRLLELGAVDAHATPVVGKKNRPAHLLRAMSTTENSDMIERAIFEETGTLGVRRRSVERRIAERSTRTIEVDGERVRIKSSSLDGVPLRSAPEYDSIRVAAERLGIPMREMRRRIDAALGADPRAWNDGEVSGP